MDIFQQIREKNIIDYGQKFEEWAPRILVDQYSDRTHFIFELLQNAEDAEATEISIELYKNRLVLSHDGREFNENDVRGICGVSASTKREDNNRIGRFGIGFKSVYAYTETPHIKSGKYDFVIKNLIMPHKVKDGDGSRKSVFELPFDLPKSKDVAFSEISEALVKNIVPDCMLTLSHIRKISFSIEGRQGMRVLTKRIRVLGSGIQDITLIESFGSEVPVQTKLIAFVSSEQKPCMIAYKIGDSANGMKTILPVTNTFLYAYFPTAIETHQSFYIHGPFDTTPARDNIRNNAYNKSLASIIAELFSKSVLWMKDKKYLSLKFFNQVYPLYAYSEDSLLYPLYVAGIELIKKREKILPTVIPGVYGNVDDTYIPESQNIVQCFDDVMLAQLFGNTNVHWIDKAIASEYSRVFRDYIQSNFGVKAVGWKLLTSKVTAELLETKSDSWLISLMRSIQPYCFSDRAEDRINAKELPLVRLENGKHCTAKGKNSKYQVYLNNPDSCSKKISETLLGDFFAKSFYSRVLEIPIYDIFEEIREDILPLYKNSSTDISIAQNILHIGLVLKAYRENSQKALDLISDKPIFLTDKGWKCSADAYVPESFFRTQASEYVLLRELNLSWLSEKYRLKISVDDLIALGCHSKVEVTEMSETQYVQLLRRIDSSLASKYETLYLSKTYHSSRDGYVHKRSISHLPMNLDSISLQASLSLAEVISSNLSVYKMKGTIYAANDAALRGKSLVSIEDFPSAIGLILTNNSWLYTKDGSGHKKPCDLRRSELHPEYERRAAALMELLPFIHEDNVVKELLGHYDPRFHAFLSELLSDHDALTEAFDSYSKKKSRTSSGNDASSAQRNNADGRSEEEITSPKSADDESSSDEEELISEIVKEIVHQTSHRRKRGSTKNGSNVSSSTSTDTEDSIEPDADEDDYTKAPVDYSKKIEQAKQKSAGEIDRIARFEYLHRKALSAPKYTYGWFTTLLELEALNSAESTQNSKEISISFGKVEMEPGTSRTLVLKQPSRYIPQYMEDLADIPLILDLGGKTKTVAIEVANVHSYNLRVKLRTNAEIDDIDLKEVREARINAQNPVFLLEALRKRFAELNYAYDFNMQKSLPENLEFIFGPPGTGKTTYLATNVILPFMKSEESRVLVLTPTNKAADVLTSRIIEKSGPNSDYKEWLVRFGVTNDEHLENSGILRDKTFDVRSLCKSVTITTVARFAYDYFMPNGERLYLHDLNWDYIVFDEASMIPIANIVYPIYKKTPKKFIIAGDPFQIAPITAVDIWKDESIYTMVKLNSFSNPITYPIQYPVKLLTTQYRSIPDVGEVFSKFAYDGILEHYRTSNAQRQLGISDAFDISTLNIVKYPVSKYESIYRAKTLAHRSPYHIYSALFSYEFVCYLARLIGKANPTQTFKIGIIAPYRAQSDLIQKLLVSAEFGTNVDVSVGTIHGFQGDECDIIIVVLNTPPTISASKEMFLNKRNILNVAISRARDYLFVIMPDDDTENVDNLHLVKQVERLMAYSKAFTEFDSHYIEELMFNNERYLEENSFATSHQNVNVYGLPEKRYEIRSEDSAVDIQIHE